MVCHHKSRSHKRSTHRTKKVKRSSKPRRKSRSKSHNTKTRGGSIRMPSEFFGKSSSRYHSSIPRIYSTAYGRSRGVSHGSIHCGSSGPNLAPGPSHSNQQTGGKRKSKKSKKTRKPKRKVKRRSKSCKSRRSRK